MMGTFQGGRERKDLHKKEKKMRSFLLFAGSTSGEFRISTILRKRMKTNKEEKR